MKSLSQYIIESRTSLNKANVSKFAEKEGMSEQIKPWYHNKYKKDDMWEEIPDDTTFADVITKMVDGQDIYTIIGAEDSIVRERVFGETAKRCGVKYDDIYYLWLNND